MRHLGAFGVLKVKCIMKIGSILPYRGMNTSTTECFPTEDWLIECLLKVQSHIYTDFHTRSQKQQVKETC